MSVSGRGLAVAGAAWIGVGILEGFYVAGRLRAAGVSLDSAQTGEELRAAIGMGEVERFALGWVIPCAAIYFGYQYGK